MDFLLFKLNFKLWMIYDSTVNFKLVFFSLYNIKYAFKESQMPRNFKLGRSV